MAIRAATAILGLALAAAAMPVAARGHHGFHGHRGFGVHHGRAQCRSYRDQDGFRRRVCV